MRSLVPAAVRSRLRPVRQRLRRLRSIVQAPPARSYLPLPVGRPGEAWEFDPDFYLRTNPDVAGAGVDPLRHYRRVGSREGRWPNRAFSPLEYRAVTAGWRGPRFEPLRHFRRTVGAPGRLVPQAVVPRRRPAPGDGSTSADGAAGSVRAIAFHLPAFHREPFNDGFWGEGFTEWDNVRRSTPLFAGHAQPRVPVGGHYDLADGTVLARQAALAGSAGIAGFAFYFYAMNGRRPLRAPLDALLAQPELEVPFCLCWANEPWIRTWEAGDRSVLIDQPMDDVDVRDAASQMVPFLRDRRYVRVGERPLVLWYRPMFGPDPLRAAALLRSVLRDAGVGEPWLVYVESRELAGDPVDPSTIGCDASVEFPPHSLVTSPLDVPHVEWTSDARPLLYSTPEMVDAAMARPRRPWIRYRGVCPARDLTPRQPNHPDVFVGSSPELFHRWVSWAKDELVASQPPEHRLLFVNAWNEWGEGSYLEADDVHGTAYLDALRDGLGLG